MVAPRRASRWCRSADQTVRLAAVVAVTPVVEIVIERPVAGASAPEDAAAVEPWTVTAGGLARVDVHLVVGLDAQEVATRDAAESVVGLSAVESPDACDQTPTNGFWSVQLETERGVEARAESLADNDRRCESPPPSAVGSAVPVASRLLDVLLEHEVHDARHGVGAVDSRGASRQHFDLVDHPHGDVGDVREVAQAIEWQREVGDAPAVHQHQ